MPSNKKDAHQRVIEKQASKQRGNDSALSEYHREQEAHEAKHGPRKVPPARRGAQSATKETLTDWLEEQKKFGRDT